jgi:hypothetical protein
MNEYELFLYETSIESLSRLSRRHDPYTPRVHHQSSPRKRPRQSEKPSASLPTESRDVE